MRYKILATALLSVLSLTGFAQWNANNTPVSGHIELQQEVRLATDAQGGAYFCWIDYRVDGQNGDIYAQRLDASGTAQWTANGLGICSHPLDQGAVAVAEDGVGGAILVWNDRRNGNRDIYAQKIDAAGNVAWATNGVAVVMKPLEQQDAKLIPDGAGGAIVVWQDSSAAGFDVYAQRISASGMPLWTAGGVAICAAINDQLNPRLETDGAGGAIITWQDKRSSVSNDIYAQRIDANGNALWAADGIVIANATGTQSNPKIEPDGTGGAYICWQDKRSGNFDVYAQRVGNNGAIQWTANGVSVCNNVGSQSAIDMTAKGGIDGAIISWKDDRSGAGDIYARRIDAAGVPQWAANGILIGNGSGPELKPNIVGDGFGNAILCWQDSSAGNWNIRSSKIDGDGTAIWTITVSAAADNQTNPKNVPDGAGGCIYGWQDKRNTVDFDIYAHHLNENGTISAISSETAPMKITVAPNPCSNSVAITLNEGLHDARLILVNAQGLQVRQLDHVDGTRIDLDGTGLANGLYHLSISRDKVRIASAKIVIVH